MNKNTGKIFVSVAALLLVAVNIFLIITYFPFGSDNQVYVVPSDSDALPISQTDISATDTTETTEPREEVVLDLPYYIEVDKIGQVVTVYTTNEEGKYEKIVRQMICSTGEEMDKLPDGYYPIKDSKHVWNTMLSHGDPLYAQYTTRITGSFLFHSVPYTKMGDKSSLDVKRFKSLGTRCSGGCIRLTVEGAKWIYDNCPVGTPVRVFKGEYNAELIEFLRPGKPVNGWDPTDPDPKNPDYRPLITTPDPQPDKYAPLYDYKWDWAPEQTRIYLTTTTTTTTTTAAPTTEPTAAESTTSATAAPTTPTTATPPAPTPDPAP